MNLFNFISNGIRLTRISFEIDKLKKPEEMPRRIQLCEEALSLFKRDENPILWALLHNDMGVSLLENPYSERANNIEEAIQSFEAALTVRTREAYPQWWADTQNNLGIAYRNRILGKPAENIEQAIQAYEAALTIYSREESPSRWSEIQNNLGVAYSERIYGQLAENLEKAIQCFENAQNTCTPLSKLWAEIQINLSSAYQERILENKANNVERAIQYAEAALTVYDKFSEGWASAKTSLGLAYRERIKGVRADNIEQAIEAFKAALNVRTLPEKWAKMQNHLGSAYLDRILGERRDNLEQAIQFYEAALTVYTKQSFPQKWADIQNNLGLIYSERIKGERIDNLELAIQAYEAALTICTHEALPAKWADTQANLGALYTERIRGERADNLERAIQCCQDALTVRTREAVPLEWAATQNDLGNAYLNRIKGERAENIEQAIAAYQSALKVFTREDTPRQWATLQNSIGNAYYNRILGERAKNIEQAIQAYEADLTVFTLQEFPQNWAMVQNNLGTAYYTRIRGERAENVERAIECFKAILDVYSCDTFPDNWAKIQTNLGNAYFNRLIGDPSKNLEEAIKFHEASLSVFTREGSPYDWAMVQTNLGAVYSNQILEKRAENLERAIQKYQKILEVYTFEGFPERWANTQVNLGTAYYKRIQGEKSDNLKQAIAYFQASLKVFTREAFPEKNIISQFGLGLAYKDDGQFSSAFTAFAAAIEVVESLRDEMVSGSGIQDKQTLSDATIQDEKLLRIEVVSASGIEDKKKLAEQWNNLYQHMVEVCLELDNPTKAIEYAERSKTRNLVEQILERDLKTIFSVDVVTQLETYRDEIATGQYQIQNGKAENPKILAQHLQELRQQRNELQNRYLPVGYGFKFDSFQATLDEHTAIIEWYILNDKILAFIVIPKGEVKVWQSQPKDQEAFRNWVNQYFQDYYNQKNQWQNSLGEELKELASIVRIDEILAKIPKPWDKLILIPHRFLHLFPLHALPVSQNSESSRCLLDLFPNGVSYAPSCQLLQQVQKRQRPDFQSLFAIQNPTEDLSFADLEVESILSYFPSHKVQVLPKKQATKAALSEAATQLKEVNYLHFSCHGSFNFNYPQNSYLQLADAYVSPIPANANPERYLKISDTGAIDLSKCLTLGNLFERNFDFSQTHLVVLSACETGLIDFKNSSDEYIGLPSGFLYAGSSSVVSSLWTVNELSTSFLLIKFIQILQDATVMSVPLAMNQAQRWLRDATKEELQEWANKLNLDGTKKGQIRRQINKMTGEKPFDFPYHWAAFTAVGK